MSRKQPLGIRISQVNRSIARHLHKGVPVPPGLAQNLADLLRKELPRPSTAPVIKRWHVTMADKTERTIEARGFRVEHGALILLLPLGCAAAYAAGTWLTIEAEPR